MALFFPDDMATSRVLNFCQETRDLESLEPEIFGPKKYL